MREGSVEERGPEIDRETMTCCEMENQPTKLWYKNAVTVIGCGVKKWINHLGIMKIKKKTYVVFDSSIRLKK